MQVIGNWAPSKRGYVEGRKELAVKIWARLGFALAICAVAFQSAEASAGPCDGYKPFVFMPPAKDFDLAADTPRPAAPVVDAGMTKAIGDLIRRQLAQDPGQLCRYRAVNFSLPARLPQGVKIVFIGDSITEFWGTADPELFTGGFVNRGIGGQTSSQLLLRFWQDVISLHPRAVQIMIGTNDLGAEHQDLMATQDNIRAMIDLARAHHITVILATIPPRRPIAAESAFNRWIVQLALEERIYLVDYASALAKNGDVNPALSLDLIHPNRAGFYVMRKTLAPVLQQAGLN